MKIKSLRYRNRYNQVYVGGQIIYIKKKAEALRKHELDEHLREAIAPVTETKKEN